MLKCSLPGDVLWGSFVTHSFLPHGRLLMTAYIYVHQSNECVTNEPQRTSAGRLAKMLLVPMSFFRLWRVDYTSEENVLTEQM